MRVSLQIEHPRASRSDFVDDLPRAIAYSQHSERIVREKQSHPGRWVQHGMTLVDDRCRDVRQIQDGWGRIHQADHSAHQPLAAYEPRRRNYERYAHILVVQEERVAIVALVLPESLAVIAVDDPKRIVVKTPGMQSGDEGT